MNPDKHKKKEEEVKPHEHAIPKPKEPWQPDEETAADDSGSNPNNNPPPPPGSTSG